MKFSYLALSVVTASLPLFAGDTAQERLTDATSVLNEIMATPDKGIPQDSLEKAHCIVIVPGVKQAAFIVGAKFGKGFATCRRDRGDGAHRERCAWRAAVSVSRSARIAPTS